MYILASLGFAFIFNMLGTINLAHGALYMVGAYLCYYLCAMAGLNNWLAMIVAAVVLAAVGLLLERVMFRPFLDDFDRIIMIGVALMTIGQTIANVLTGNQALVIPSYAKGTTTILGLSVSNERLLTFGIGLVLRWSRSTSSTGRRWGVRWRLWPRTGWAPLSWALTSTRSPP